jgi:uncharacterized membrane protein
MDERELRERFDAIGVPPSRVHVGALVAEGRRRVKRRRSWQAAGGAALAIGGLLVVPSVVFHPRPGPNLSDGVPVASRTASAPVSPAGSVPAAPCVMTNLPLPKGFTSVSVVAVDPTGRYIVGNGFSGQNFLPVLWTDGKPQALPMRGESVELSAVNSQGVVVGLITENNKDYTFRYQNGRYTKLRTPAGSWRVYPVPEINTVGDIVINAEPSGNTGGKDSIALIWPAGATAAMKIALPDGANVMAITDDGTMIGTMYKNGGAVAGYAWDAQGRTHKLTTPSGQTAAAYAGRGDWATGGLWPRESAVRWNLRTGKLTEFKAPADADLAPAMDGLGPGEKVNAKGWVVVSGYVMRDDGPATLPVPTGLRAVAKDVSDDGLVVGQTVNAADTVVPRTWRC